MFSGATQQFWNAEIMDGQGYREFLFVNQRRIRGALVHKRWSVKVYLPVKLAPMKLPVRV